MAALTGGATLLAATLRTGGSVVTRARIEWGASAVIFAGLLALIVDMFLGWVKVTVYSAGLFGTPLTFDMQVTGSGWASWGIVGGILAVVLVFWHAWSLRRRWATVGTAAVTVALAGATAGFTIWQALTGEADVVSAEGTLIVTVTRLWPAEAAIGLTAAVAAGATTRLLIAAVGIRRSGDRQERRSASEHAMTADSRAANVSPHRIHTRRPARFYAGRPWSERKVLMTPRTEVATRRVRAAALVLIAGLVAGPLASHVYWMLGGTWGLGGAEEYHATGIRIVGAVVSLLVIGAVLVVLARVGMWQQAIVPDLLIRFLAWALAAFFLLETLASFTWGRGPELWLYGPVSLVLALLGLVVANSGGAWRIQRPQRMRTSH